MTALRKLGKQALRFWVLASAILVAGAILLAAPAAASLAAPDSVTVTRGDGVLNVTWSAVTGADFYNVNTSDDGRATWQRAKSRVTGTSTTLTGITNASTYVVSVQAVSSGGIAGKWGDSSPAGPYTPPSTPAPTPPTTAPAAPSSVTATRGTFGQGLLTVSWTASDGAAWYNVRTSDDNGSTWTAGPAEVKSTSATVTGVYDALPVIAAVQAVNAIGSSGWAQSPIADVECPDGHACITDATPPFQPTTVTATAGDGSLTVSWTAVSDATSYNVNVSDNHKSTWSRAKSGATGTSATVTGLTNSATYYAAVQAVNSAGVSAWSVSPAAGPYTPPASVPGAPASVTVTRGDGTLSVSWDAVSGATSYNVNTSDNGGASWSRAKSGVTGTSAAITGATNSSTYVVAVQAVNSAGGGGWRNSDSAGPYTPPSTSPSPTASPTPSPTPLPSPPATPSSVTVTRSDETLHASWPAVTGATGYHITVAFASAGNRSWVAVATNHPTNSIDIKHVLNTPSYIVGVRALNAGGGSGWRNSAPTGGFYSPKPLPDMPSSVTITRGDGTLTDSWPDANNATSYSVFLKDNSDGKWKEGALFTEATSTTHDASNYLDYTASVRSHNGTGDSYSRDSAVSAATATLLPPSYVAVTRGDGTLSASWGPADGATSYHVGWSDNNGKSWYRERASYVGTTIDFTVPKVDNGKSYMVSVMSTIGDVQSAWRYSEVSPPYTTGTPARPSSVTVTRSDGALTATWNAAANASTYHVTYSSDGRHSWSLAAYGHTGTSIDIAGADNAKTYVVAVRGVNSQGDGGSWRNSAAAGPYTPPATPTPTPAPNPPAAPANLAVAPGESFTGIGITWDASEGATGYDVRVKAQGSSAWLSVATNVSGTS